VLRPRGGLCDERVLGRRRNRGPHRRALTRGRRHAGHLGLCRGADPPRYRCCPLVEEAPNDMLGMRYLVLFALLLSTFSGRMITVREEIAA
jgi:hypothetical protein